MMEEIESLEDVIEDLVDRGYSLSFEPLRQAKFDLSSHEFIIDEIHPCYDSSPDIIYVFAISSLRYKLKVIVINAIVINPTTSPGEIIKKIKIAFLRLFSF